MQQIQGRQVSAPQGFAMIPRAVLVDPTVSADAKIVFLVLSSHVGDKDTVWPSHQTIATMAGISTSQVKRKLKELKDHNLIDWKERRTEKERSLTNEYWLTVGNVPAQKKRVAHPGPHPGGTPSTQDPVPPEPGGVPRDLRTRVIERESKKKTSPTGVGVAAKFDAFWDVYPRREGKGAAQASFARALKKVTFEVIMRGATRYRDDPNRDQSYTAHPTTWLNQARWDDDPLPVRGETKRAEVAEPAWKQDAQHRQNRFGGLA